MIDMTDPSIQSFERPMLDEDIADIGDAGIANFNEYYFNYGVVLKSRKTGEYLALPESLGRFRSRYHLTDVKPPEIVDGPALNCSEVFSHLYEDQKPDVQSAINLGQCADPEAASTAGM